MSTRPIKRTRATYQTWVIETGMPEEPYFLIRGMPLTHPSRRNARLNLASLKASFRLPQAARAVRVAVTVTTIGRG